MKNYIFLFFLFGYSLVNAQEKKDSIVKNNNKSYFIGLDLAFGLGWRTYNNSTLNNPTIYKVEPSKEMYGKSYAIGINWGITKKTWDFILGLDYSNIQYFNNAATVPIYIHGSSPNADTVQARYKYTFIHKYFCIPVAFNYHLGKKKNWFVGGDFSLGYLFYFHQKIAYSSYSWQSDLDYTKQPFFLIGAKFGRNIIMSKKINLNICYSIKYSSIISGGYQSSNNLNNSMELYETRPHSLLINSINIAFQYKI